MAPGQRVRVKSASNLARSKDFAAGETATILCCYKVRGRACERVDVKFASEAILWGVSADEFEPLEGVDLPIAP